MTDANATREWELWDAEELAAELEGFTIPTPAEREAVIPGDIVKLVFGIVHPTTEIAAERMWVIVDGLDAAGFVGTLDSDPEYIPALKAGDQVEFSAAHIIDIYDDEATGQGGCGGNCQCSCGA